MPSGQMPDLWPQCLPIGYEDLSQIGFVRWSSEHVSSVSSVRRRTPVSPETPVSSVQTPVSSVQTPESLCLRSSWLNQDLWVAQYPLIEPSSCRTRRSRPVLVPSDQRRTRVSSDRWQAVRTLVSSWRSQDLWTPPHLTEPAPSPAQTLWPSVSPWPSQDLRSRPVLVPSERSRDLLTPVSPC